MMLMVSTHTRHNVTNLKCGREYCVDRALITLRCASFLCVKYLWQLWPQSLFWESEARQLRNHCDGAGSRVIQMDFHVKSLCWNNSIVTGRSLVMEALVSMESYNDCFSSFSVWSTVLPDTSRKSRQKTRAVAKTTNPVFNHTMVYDGFKPEDLKEACVELTVWDHNKLVNHFVGGLRIGLGTGILSWVEVPQAYVC